MKSDRSADLALVREKRPDQLDRLDAGAVKLAVDFKAEGVVAFTIRSLHDGNVRILGPGLNRARVVQMLRQAADSVEAGNIDQQVKH